MAASRWRQDYYDETTLQSRRTKVENVVVQEKKLPGLPPLPAKGGKYRQRIADLTPPSRAAKPWKPATLRPLFLSCMILLSCGLISVLQVLLCKSGDDHILLAPDDGDLSTAQYFLYIYFPVIVIVLYGIAWGWLDLDARRFEPYAQLSRPTGASGKESILLDYVSTFFAWVPVKAALYGHWSVFCTGIGTVLVFVAITPFAASVFNVVSQDYVSNLDVVDTAQFLPLDAQADILNANIFNDVYAFSVLNASLPQFTTEDRALLPYNFISAPKNVSTTDSLTATTKSFGTRLSCYQPNKEKSCQTDDRDPRFWFSNGKGCAASQSASIRGATGSTPGLTDLEPEYNYGLTYQGWYDGLFYSTGPTSRNECSQCSAQLSNNWLAFWQDRNSSVAMWCESSYFEQDVLATVDSTNYSVISVEPLGEQQPFDVSLFNTSAFESLLCRAGDYLRLPVLPSSGEDSGGIKNTLILNQGDLEAQLQMPRPSDIGSYALHVLGRNISDYKDPDVLAQAFEKTHQLLFAFAMSKVLSPTSVSSPLRTGQYHHFGITVTMQPQFVLLTQISLGLLTILAVVLMINSLRRQSNLQRDPSSIFRTMSLFSESLEFSISQKYQYPYKDNVVLQQDRFRLLSPSDTVMHKPQIVADSTGVSMDEDQDQQTSPRVQPSTPRSTQPRGLKTISLLGVLLMLAAAVVTLCVLQSKLRNENGIPLTINGSFAQQVVLSYIPTISSTLLESFWVLVTRDIGFLQPYETLSRGESHRNNTMEAKYTSVPPQVVCVRAAVGKHYILATLGVVTLLCNVLAVAFSGLFNIRSIAIYPEATFGQRPVKFVPGPTPPFYDSDYAPWASNHSLYDYFYVMDRSLDWDGVMPPWATKDFFFVPFYYQTPEPIPSDSPRTAITRGIGVSVGCTSDGIATEIHSILVGNVTVPPAGDEDSESKCKVDLRLYSSDDQDLSLDRFAGEFLSPLVTSADAQLLSQMTVAHWQSIENSRLGANVLSCLEGLVAGWLRTKPRVGEDVLFAANQTSVAGRFVSCQPQLRSALFNVTIGSDERIVKATQVGEFENIDDLDLFSSRFDQSNYLQLAFQQLKTVQLDDKWHNDTIPWDWVNYFMNKMTNSTSNIDPNASLPDTAVVVPLMEEVMRRYFSIFFSMNLQLLQPVSDQAEQTIIGSYRTMQSRVFFAPYMFQISVALLAFNILVILVLLFRRRTCSLPVMPNTIAAVASYVALSHLQENVRYYGRPGYEDMIDNDDTFAFGRCVGRDGAPCVGIERHPFVTPLEASAWQNKLLRCLRLG